MRLKKQLLEWFLSRYNNTLISHDYPQAINFFYKAYLLSLNHIGYTDKKYKEKMTVYVRYLQSFTNKEDKSLLFKIQETISNDMKIINLAIEDLQDKEREESVLGDLYQPEMLLISVEDE